MNDEARRLLQDQNALIDATRKTPFKLVSAMNTAFGNPQGDANNIDWQRLASQCKNILDEFNELMLAIQQRNIYATRDALCDVHVFAYGAHHLMGLDADADMRTVVEGVMTRFCRDEQELEATKAKFAAAGVTKTYTQGNFPTMVLKSAFDQPDAPKDKFLKSVGYSEPIFTHGPGQTPEPKTSEPLHFKGRVDERN